MGDRIMANPMAAGLGALTPRTASRSSGSAGGSGAASADPPTPLAAGLRSDTAAPTPQAAASPRSSSGNVHLKVKLRVPGHSNPEVVLKAFREIRETLEKGNVGDWDVHVDHDATQATIVCRQESAKAVQEVLKEHLKAEHLDAAVEEQTSVTMYPRITVYKLSAIDSAAQAWEGEVVVELLFVVNIEARVNAEKSKAEAAARSASVLAASSLSAAKKEEVATSALAAAPAAAEVAAAGAGPVGDEVVEVLVAAADRWEVYPHAMRRGGGALLGDLHLPENKELSKAIERLFAYKVANYESDSTKSDSREKWARLHVYRRLKGEDPERFRLQSVFSVFERLNGRFSQRFKLKNFPLDTQKLRIEIEAGRAELLRFWKPTHQKSHKPEWLEELHAEEQKKEAAFLWPWLEIEPTADNTVKSANAEAAEKAKPTRGSFIVVKDKAMPVYAEWLSFSKVHEKWSNTSAAHSRNGVVYGKYIFQIYVARRPMRVLVSKTFPSFLMVCSAFSAESLPTADAAARLQIIIALMLSVVFLNADSASTFEELTLSSKYAISSLVVLALCVLEVAVAKALNESPWGDDSSAFFNGAAASSGPAIDAFAFDFVAWQFLLALWLTINVLFLFTAARAYYKRFLLRKRDETAGSSKDESSRVFRGGSGIQTASQQ